MTEYYISAENAGFKVAKFDGGSEQPLAIYTLEQVKKKLKCDCPAGMFRGKCKHEGMVKAFLDAGSPVPFVLQGEV